MKSRNFRPINILLTIFSIFFAILQVILLNFDSTSGTVLSKLNDETDKIEIDNIKLNQEIASASAIVTISVKASELGLIQNQKLISLNGALPIALSSGRSL